MANTNFIDPMLAERSPKKKSELLTLLRNTDYVFEYKFDGERCIATKSGNDIQLQARSGNIKTGRYPELIPELQRFKDSFILDGEIVILNENGVPNFNALQARLNLQDKRRIEILSKTTPVIYIVYDVLQIGGINVENNSWDMRKKLLRKIFANSNIDPYTGRIKISENFADGVNLYETAMKAGYEGIVAKLKTGAYYRGKRGKEWIKIKGEESADCIVIGYTDPNEGKREKWFGALVLAQYDGTGKLRYVGKVGTGFNDKQLADLFKYFQMHDIAVSVWQNDISRKDVGEDYHMIGHGDGTAAFVAEIRCLERSKDGILRFPVFKQLRTDKSPDKCFIESTVGKLEIVVDDGLCPKCKFMHGDKGCIE